MLKVEEALDRILGRCVPGQTEQVSIGDAYHRVLAFDQRSAIDLPPFDNSSVDGYAVRAADLAYASARSPVVLPIAFLQAAGTGDVLSLDRGSTAQVLTGAPMPGGADAVVMQEDTKLIGEQNVAFTAACAAGQFIRNRGSDVRAGDSIVGHSVRLGPAELAMLAGSGSSSVTVYQRPRVAILTTGDEIEDVETCRTLPPGRIYNSNRYCLEAMVKECDAAIALMLHVQDDYEDTCSALRVAAVAGVDVIVCAGGVSVGARDYVKPALESMGKLDLWRVAMKPGKPVAFGSIGDALFFGLPGNPASVMVTFELFLRPCLLKLGGRTDLERPVVKSRLVDGIDHEPGRREYVRARTQWGEAGYESTTTGAQGSGRLRSMVDSNSLVIVPEQLGSLQAGETVQAMLLAP